MIATVFTATIVGYGCWAAFTGHGRITPLRIGYGPDSALYVRAARAPLWSAEFLATPHGGPFLYLVVAKLCLRDLRAIVVVQSLIAAAAWVFLARCVSGLLSDPLVRTAGFVVMLLIALSPPVLLWNAVISTESLAVSLLALAVALWLRVATGGDQKSIFLLVVVLIALACTRDTNAYLLLAIGVLAAAVAVARGHLRRRAIVMAVACLLGAILTIGLSNHARRWYYPVSETITLRIMGSPMATKYFVAHGMPEEARLQIEHDTYAGLPHALASGPEYRAFQVWVLNHGRSTYTTFLATHPGWDLGKPFADRRRFLAPSLLQYGAAYDIEPQGLFRALGALGFPGSVVLVEVWAAGAVLAAVAFARTRTRRPLVTAIAVTSGLAIVSFVLSWHGDALETDRHSLSAAVELRIALWVVAAITLDLAATRIRSRKCQAPDTRGRVRRR